MSYESKFKNKESELLFDAILSLEDKEECYRFFEDVCTISELHSMAQRYYVATLLDQNMTYQEIEDSTNVSTATISRVNKCLKYGSDGYKIAILKSKKNKKLL